MPPRRSHVLRGPLPEALFSGTLEPRCCRAPGCLPRLPARSQGKVTLWRCVASAGSSEPGGGTDAPVVVASGKGGDRWFCLGCLEAVMNGKARIRLSGRRPQGALAVTRDIERRVVQAKHLAHA